MSITTGQPSEPEQPDRSDPQRVKQLANRLLELQSVDESVGIEAVLQELDPSIRPLYLDSIEEYLQSISASPRPNLDTLTPEESAEIASRNESVTSTDRKRDDATVDLPIGFEAPPRNRALPPAKRPRVKKDRCFVGQGGDHLPLPERIGKFRIKGELGRGACGVVYLGFDEELQRNVAIKVSLVADQRVQERLRIEASKAAQIDSDGIVPVYHIGTTDEGAVYVVQKYIQGTNLRVILESDGPVSPARAVSVLGEITLALEPAHSQDILHRDLKPDNILVDENGKLWIADFGLAISEEEQQGRRGELAGTPVYMSPEQIQGRTDFLDARSDIWALGVMLYELLSGKLPFNGKDRKTLTEQICELDPRPLHQRSPKYLTEDLNNVFTRCCAKKPSDRYASATELLHALEELIAAGLGEQNINGETVTGFVGDSPIDYDTLGTRFSLSVSGHGRLGSTVESVDEGFAHEPSANKKKVVLMGGGALLCTAGILAALSAFGVISPDLLNIANNQKSVDSGPTSNGGVGDSSEPPPPQLNPAGTPDDPWVVAAEGSARSHQTIQAAIEDAKDGDFIHVLSGHYDESCRINKSLTIIGAGRSDCTLRNSAAAPLTVGDEGTAPTVRIRNIKIDGSGVGVEADSNTIELNTGTLVLETCHVLAETQNCIKAGTKAVRPQAPMNVAAFNTTFGCSDGFAVSLIRHTAADFQGCDFKSGSGIQLIDGPGSIHCCTFFGRKGVYLESNPGEPIHIVDCWFDKCRDYGVAAVDDVTALIEESDFVNCAVGCQALASVAAPTPGNIAVFGSRFENCDTAVIGMGKLRVDHQCVISGGDFGLIVKVANQLKSASMKDTQIHDVKEVGVRLLAGKLVVDSIELQRSGSVAIEVKDGKLEARSIDIRQSGTVGIAVENGAIDVDGGQIVNVNRAEGTDSQDSTDGISIRGNGKSSLKNLVLIDNTYGIYVGSPRCDVQDVKVLGGSHGIYARNDTKKPVPSIKVFLKSVVFGGQEKFGIYVSGQDAGVAEVSISDVDFGDLSVDQETQKVKGGLVTRPDAI